MILTKDRYRSIIKERISLLRSNVRTENRDLNYGINRAAESFYAEFLNLIYGVNLKNGNTETHDLAAVDLIDEENRISVQVTSDTSSTKVKHTLEQFYKNNCAEHYDRLIILIITEKIEHKRAYKDLPFTGIAFDPATDIIDCDDLVTELEKPVYNLDRLRSIAEFLSENVTLTEFPESQNRAIDNSFDSYCEQIWSACQRRYEDIRKPGNRFDWDIIETLLPNGLVNSADFECIGKKADETPRLMLDIVESTDANIAIIGEGGIGKTTFLRKMLASMLRDENDDPKPYDSTESIPIFIELHRCPPAIANWKDPALNKTNFITRYIAQILENHSSLHQVSSKNLELVEKLMQGIPEKGQKPRFLLLLDGFNEVQSNKEIDVRSYLSNELSVLCSDEYKGVRILTTSRPTETAYYARKFENITAVGQQPDVICKFLADTGKTETEISIIRENKALMHILAVPLYLCMFSAVVSTTDILPETRGEILCNFFHKETAEYNLRTRLTAADTTGLEQSAQDVIIDFILPYIGWRFELENAFSVNVSELRLMIDEAVQIVVEVFGIAEANPFVRFEYTGVLLSHSASNLKNKVDEVIKYVSDFCGILYHFMEVTEDYSNRYRYGFIHHQFRDYFSAMFDIRLLEMTSCIGTENYSEYAPYINQNLWPPYKSELIGQILLERLNGPVYDEHRKIWYMPARNYECQHVLENGIDFCRRLESASLDYYTLLKNIMRTIKIIRRDFSGLDLSDLNFKGQHFFNVNCSKPSGMRRIAASFRNSVFDGDCFETEDHQDVIIEIVYHGDDCFTVDQEGVIKCWDIRSGVLKYTLMAVGPSGLHDMSTSGYLTFSVDGKWLAAKGQFNMMGQREMSISLFDLTSVDHTRRVIRLPGDHMVLDSIAFAHDSSCLYALCDHSVLYFVSIDEDLLWEKKLEYLQRHNDIYVTSDTGRVYINSYSVLYDEFDRQDEDYEEDADEEDLMDDESPGEKFYELFSKAEVGLFIEINHSASDNITVSDRIVYSSYPGMSAALNYFDELGVVVYFDYHSDDGTMAIRCFDIATGSIDEYFEDILAENDTQPYSIIQRPGFSNELYMIFPKNIYQMHVSNSGLLKIDRIYPLSGVISALDSADPELFSFVCNGLSQDKRFLFRDDRTTYEWDTKNNVIERKYNTVYYETSFMTVNSQRDQLILVHQMNGVSLFKGNPINCVSHYCYQEPGYSAEKAAYYEPENRLAIVFVREDLEVVKIVDIEHMYEKSIFATSLAYETISTLCFSVDGTRLLVSTQYRCVEIDVKSGDVCEINRSSSFERYAGAFYCDEKIGIVVVRDTIDAPQEVRNRCECYAQMPDGFAVTSYYIIPELGEYKDWFIFRNNDMGFEGEIDDNDMQKYWVTEGFFLADIPCPLPLIEYYEMRDNAFVRSDRQLQPFDRVWVSHDKALQKFDLNKAYYSYSFFDRNGVVFMKDSQDLLYVTDLKNTTYASLKEGFERKIGSYDGNAVWGFAVPWNHDRIVGCAESMRLLVQNTVTGDEEYEVNYYPGLNLYGCDFRGACLDDIDKLKVEASGGRIK